MRVVLLLMFACFGCAPPPLTKARVLKVMPEDPPLELAFNTGPDNVQLRCQDNPPPTYEHAPETAVAIAVGWVERVCENDHIVRRLTAEGRRRSAGWGRSGDSPLRPREPEDPNETTSWFITAGRFERDGAIDVLPQPSRDDLANVVVHGRWLPNEEGKLLQRAGWKKVDERSYEELFAMKNRTWYRAQALD